MKKILTYAAIAIGMIVLGSCGGTKKVVYFQNADTVDLTASRGLYDARIMPKDQLTVTVFSSDPLTAAPYNQTVSNTLNGDQLQSGGGMLQTYLVDNDGNIKFPNVGVLHVQGLTKGECEDLILEKIKGVFGESTPPVVTVRMSSYRVTVDGEVASPGVFPITSEKMSIIEALAQAGDLTMYGRRDNVMLIREDATGQKSIHRIDLRDANLLNSPLYYVQQNDIIYVEPNKVKANNAKVGQSTTIWFSVISILTSLTSLIVNLTK